MKSQFKTIFLTFLHLWDKTTSKWTRKLPPIFYKVNIDIWNLNFVQGLVTVFLAVSEGGGEMGSMYVLSYQLCWYVQIYIYLTLWYVHVPRSVQRYVHVPRYLYECSTCRYVRLNALNALHAHRPCFNSPFLKACKKTTAMNTLIQMFKK